MSICRLPGGFEPGLFAVAPLCDNAPPGRAWRGWVVTEKENNGVATDVVRDREGAWALFCEWTESESLRKHVLAVEAAMRAYARRFGEDEEAWAVVGILHDLDYERYPTMDGTGHPFKAVEYLRSIGYPEVVTRAILSHADYSGVTRESRMEHALFAVDELTGFISAVALVRPSKRVADVDAKSVRKKMKDKAFARAVNRDDLPQGAAELGLDFDEHIAFTVEALVAQADRLGLAGISES
ncbi:MAG TPA: HDIG domain-containing metalloprotein [Thermomicrobiales bacterium]